ncbi:MAG: thioredoxin family protein [Chloroflexi bacterium]|nr:thioredoxin family protein [Chloroflexota bacterium]MCH7655204.1 thioredoxin family protein [Chloroflexota bacterium]
MTNEHIRAEVIEVQEFPEVAQRYQVRGVPKTVINDNAEFVGAVPDEMFVDAILESLGKPPVEWAVPDPPPAPSTSL